jgi:hypothetical protein
MSDSEDDAASSNELVNERRDPPGLITQPTEGWKYKPRVAITLIKDSASSATIAARHVFCYGGSYPMTDAERERARHNPDPDEEPDLPQLREISCHMHASLRWCHTNQAKFNAYVGADGTEFSRTQARNQFMHDLDYVIKPLQFVHFKGVALRLLRQKWTKLDNKEAVKAWLKFWGTKQLTRSEANQADVSPLLGGIPCDNNALESSNNVDKGLLSRDTATATEFIGDLAAKVVGPLSASDTQFVSTLKQRCGNKKQLFSSAPNNMKFLDHVRSLWQIYKEDEDDDQIQEDMERPHILRCNYLFTKKNLGIPKKSFYLLSDHGISDFQEYMADQAMNPNKLDPDLLGEFSQFVEEQNWNYLITSMIADPMKTVDEEEIDFDEFAEWCRCFYVMRPIKFHPTDWDFPSNRSLVHWLEMMKLSGFGVADQEEIVNKRRSGIVFYACTCPMYLHYLVCKHSLLTAMQCGLVTKLPKGPKRLHDRKAGRKRKAKGGEALTTQG